MGNKVISVFSILIFMLGLCIFRMADLSTGEYANSAAGRGTISLEIANGRGDIYDCSMNNLVNETREFYALANPTSRAIEALKNHIDGDSIEAITERMSKGYPVSVRVDTDKINCEDIKIVEIYNRYTAKQTALHLIGYLKDGKGASGLESSFNDILTSEKRICSARFKTDVYGRALAGSDIIITNTINDYKNGIQLTIDKKIQGFAEKAAESKLPEKGAVVVMDVNSGEIKAMVSLPEYDINNISKSLNDERAPFINRATSSFSVGSVFKCAIAAAAIEQGKADFKYNCTGKTKQSDIEFNCHKEDGHGNIDMQTAIMFSCNTYFINLAESLDMDKTLNIISQMGFGTELTLANGIISKAGNLPQISDLNSNAAIANFAFGQGILTATPLQICAMTACIANGGKYTEPTLIKGTVDKNGGIKEISKTASLPVLSEHTSEILSKYMVSTVESGNARNAKPKNGGAGGKTATSQSGSYSEKNEILNTWFTGFYPAENPKYAITVLCENGSAGSTDCAPIFKEICDMIDLL